MKKNELPKVQPVHLKSFLGMKPGVWLTVLYSLILILVVLLICIVPDLAHPSKRITYTSEVYNAAVYLDGNYAGGTPFTKKTASGEHTVTFKVNDVQLDSFQINVSKPVFLAWLFPRKGEVHSSAFLTQEAYCSLVAEFLEDLCAYSAVTEYDSVHVYPPLFTDFARTVEKSLSVCNGYEDILKASLSFVTSNEMLEDAENAFSILGISHDFSQVREFVDKPVYDTKAVKQSSVYTKNNLSTPYFEVRGYQVGDFCVARNCVSESMYKVFALSNPQWLPENKEELIKNGLADSYYLTSVNWDSASDTKPVRNISYYAAEAFCNWLSDITGRTVSLPSESQWIASSAVAESNYQKTLISISSEDRPVGMFGGLWEMTDTVFVPNQAASSLDVQSLLLEYGITGEMTVKGGSYLNNGITAAVRGSLPKTTCSDFLGFRIFWY